MLPKISYHMRIINSDSNKMIIEDKYIPPNRDQYNHIKEFSFDDIDNYYIDKDSYKIDDSIITMEFYIHDINHFIYLYKIWYDISNKIVIIYHIDKDSNDILNTIAKIPLQSNNNESSDYNDNDYKEYFIKQISHIIIYFSKLFLLCL